MLAGLCEGPKRLLLAVGLAVVASAAAPKHDWKTGTLVDVGEVQEVAGSTAGNAVGAPDAVRANQKVLYSTLQGFVIKGDGIEWVIKVRIPSTTALGHPKRPNVTVNAPVKYCYEKGKFYLLDDDGKKFEMVIMRKEALP